MDRRSLINNLKKPNQEQRQEEAKDLHCFAAFSRIVVSSKDRDRGGGAGNVYTKASITKSTKIFLIKLLFSDTFSSVLIL